jgi:hypothetical protein
MEEAEVRTIRPRPRDRLILATDGVWKWVEDDLLSLCRPHPEPQECADRLIQTAVERRGWDNATCIVVAFDSVNVNPAWLSWNGGTVARLVRSIREEKLFAHLPVLADALEDAGCDEAALLEHLRGPVAHGPGCWALDLLGSPR